MFDLAYGWLSKNIVMRAPPCPKICRVYITKIFVKFFVFPFSITRTCFSVTFVSTQILPPVIVHEVENALVAATKTSGGFTYIKKADSSVNFVTDGTAAVTLAAGDVVIAGTNGTAAVAASTTPAAKDFTVYSGIDINIKASTTTDNGMTISAATDMGAGSIPDIADKELEAQTDDLTAPEVKIGYNGVTIELQSEGVDD